MTTYGFDETVPRATDLSMRHMYASLFERLDIHLPNPEDDVRHCNGVMLIKHSAVEYMAVSAGIKFLAPEVILKDLETKHVAMLITGGLGEGWEWTVAEAAPYNNKNGYPFATAEARGKDRVTLKLLGLYGKIYSDADLDDFTPHAEPIG